MSEVVETKTAAPILMADSSLIAKTFSFDVPVGGTSGWFLPDNPVQNFWYVALYLGDKAPCILKFEKGFWRTPDGRLASIPMHVLRLPSPPPLKKVKDDK